MPVQNTPRVQAAVELPPPHENMAQLAWFLGEWTVESRYFQGEDKGWLEETITAIHQPVIGGHVIWEHFYGTLLNEPLEAWSLRKFDAKNGYWEQRWVDNTPGGFAAWMGRYDAGAHTYTGYAKRFIDAEFNIVGDTAVREVFYNIETGRFSWKFERSQDGGATWDVIWTLEYKRLPST